MLKLLAISSYHQWCIKMFMAGCSTDVNDVTTLIKRVQSQHNCLNQMRLSVSCCNHWGESFSAAKLFVELVIKFRCETFTAPVSWLSKSHAKKFFCFFFRLSMPTENCVRKFFISPAAVCGESRKKGATEKRLKRKNWYREMPGLGADHVPMMNERSVSWNRLKVAHYRTRMKLLLWCGSRKQKIYDFFCCPTNVCGLFFPPLAVSQTTAINVLRSEIIFPHYIMQKKGNVNDGDNKIIQSWS